MARTITTERGWLKTWHARELWSAPVARDPRRRRLGACACARRVLPLLDDAPAAVAVVEAAERYADDRTAPANWRSVVAARTALQQLFDDLANIKTSTVRRRYALHAVRAVSAADASGMAKVFTWAHMARRGRPLARGVTEPAAQHAIIRDIFGNPFRPVAFSPKWRTSTAVSLARTMYDSREFSAMPILADALQDAGCDNEDVLKHCRSAKPKQVHVRGCWVVDLVLGKT